MCTSIIEIARAEGMAKRGDEWFPLSQAVVAYDHARHAPLGDVITLDFINTDLDGHDQIIAIDNDTRCAGFGGSPAPKIMQASLGGMAVNSSIT